MHKKGEHYARLLLENVMNRAMHRLSIEHAQRMDDPYPATGIKADRRHLDQCDTTGEGVESLVDALRVANLRNAT